MNHNIVRVVADKISRYNAHIESLYTHLECHREMTADATLAIARVRWLMRPICNGRLFDDSLKIALAWAYDEVSKYTDSRLCAGEKACFAVFMLVKEADMASIKLGEALRKYPFDQDGVAALLQTCAFVHDALYELIDALAILTDPEQPALKVDETVDFVHSAARYYESVMTEPG